MKNETAFLNSTDHFHIFMLLTVINRKKSEAASNSQMKHVPNIIKFYKRCKYQKERFHKIILIKHLEIRKKQYLKNL